MAPQFAAAARSLVAPVAGAFVGMAILLFSLQIRDAGNSLYGPRFWPQMIGGLMLAINAWAIFRTLTGHPDPADEPLDGGAVPVDFRGVPLRYWGTALLVLGFPLMVHALGFLVGSAVFLASFMVGLGYRRFSVVALTAFTFSVLLTWFFTAGVFTPLPSGKGPFYVVSTEFVRIVSGKR